MDNREQDLLGKALEAARSKLNDVQHQKLDQFCQDLKERKIYTHALALKAERVVRTERDNYLRSELQNIIEKAEKSALEQSNRSHIEAARHKEYLVKKDEERRLAALLQAEKQRDEKVRQADKTKQEIAQNERKDGPLQQSDATLEQSKAQQAQLEAEQAHAQQLVEAAQGLRQNDDRAAEAWVAQAETDDRQHHQFGAYDELRGIPPGGQAHEDPRPDNNLPPGAELQNTALDAVEAHQPSTPVPTQPSGPEAALQTGDVTWETPEQVPALPVQEHEAALPTEPIHEAEPAVEPVVPQTQEQAITVPVEEPQRQESALVSLAAQDQEIGLSADSVAVETPEPIVVAPAHGQQHEVETGASPSKPVELETGLMADFVAAAPPEQAVAAPTHEQQHHEVEAGAPEPTVPEQAPNSMAGFVTAETKAEVAVERAQQHQQEQPRTIEPSLIQAAEAQVETGMMASFVTAETKAEMAAERAQKEIERQWQEAGPSLTM